jgi:hypothetical protein
MGTTIDDLFPSRYLKAADLKGQKRTLTISKITSEEVGKDKKAEPIIYFQKCTKGLVLNKTNAKRIAEVLGSKALADWPGKSVALYSKMVEFAGDLVPAIRIDAASGNGSAAVADELAPPPESEEAIFEDDAREPPGDLVDDIPDFLAPSPAEEKKPAKRGRKPGKGRK